MTLKNRERKILIGGAAACALILAVGFFGIPLARQWFTQRGILRSRLREVERLKSRAGAQARLTARRNELVKRVGLLLGPEADVPAPQPENANKPQPEAGKPAGSVSLATHVNRIAGEAGVQLERVTPTKPQNAMPSSPSFTPAAVQISATATGQSMVKFLYEIEKGQRVGRVEDAEIHRDLQKDAGNLHITFRIVGYEKAGE